MRALNIGVQCGVTTGTVFCGNVGNVTTRCEYAAVGADVNLAARLMGKDKRGDILVDGRTAEAASKVFRFRPLEYMLTLKGVEGPVQSFFPASFSRRLTSLQAINDAELSSKALVFGRDKIMNKCIEQIMGQGIRNDDKVCHKGAFVAVLGTPGVGKTAVLNGIRKIAEETHNALCFSTSGDHHRISIPFFPLRSMVLKALLLIAGDEMGPLSQMKDALFDCGKMFEPCKVQGVEDTVSGTQFCSLENWSPMFFFVS